MDGRMEELISKSKKHAHQIETEITNKIAKTLGTVGRQSQQQSAMSLYNSLQVIHENTGSQTKKTVWAKKQ